MNKVHLEVCVLACLMLVSSGLALECYLCNTEEDGSDCRENDPKTDKLDRYISDDKDTCYVCFKATYDDGDGEEQTARGCMSRDTYRLVGVSTGECDTVTLGSYSSAKLCICDDDKCNAGGHVTASLLTAITSLLLVYAL